MTSSSSSSSLESANVGGAFFTSLKSTSNRSRRNAGSASSLNARRLAYRDSFHSHTRKDAFVRALPTSAAQHATQSSCAAREDVARSKDSHELRAHSLAMNPRSAHALASRADAVDANVAVTPRATTAERRARIGVRSDVTIERRLVF